MTDERFTDGGPLVELAPNLWRVSLPMPEMFMAAVNVYVIRDTDGYVLVDCGLAIDESWEGLRACLEGLGAPIDAVHTVIVTHGHHDHSGLAQRLREHHGARIWLHESDWTYVQRRYGDPAAFQALASGFLRRYGVPADESVKLAVTLGLGLQIVPLGQPDRILEGGETVDVGEYRFEILWTPGHTPGHVCVLEPTRGMMLAGDHILPGVNPNVSLQPYARVNPLPAYLDSLRRIADMGLKLTLPGHGEPMSSVAKRVIGMLEHQDDRRQRALRTLTDTPRTPYELAASIWPEPEDGSPRGWKHFPPNLRRNAIGTLVAHLELLVEDGLAQRTEDEQVRFAAR